MPTLQKHLHGANRSFDARPDRFDLRDRIYQPKLVNLPPEYPTKQAALGMLKAYAPLVLDQGSEGACTGFGLAAMVNFLRFRDAVIADAMTGKLKPKAKVPERVSPRMLYENARLYDEWPGEDYDGSSCRGAMKGWHRHGVCDEMTWPYFEADGITKGKPGPNWQDIAAGIPLGAYYRIETDDITALQSAILEVGAVYASANVHKGWDLKKESHLPQISWKPKMVADAGHAFSLVGFNQLGFVVQNSWGDTWGYKGFAIFTYEDWLENATDAWVAALGVPRGQSPVPVNFSSRSIHLSAGGASAARASVPANVTVWSEDEARSHCLVIGNDGVLLRSSAAYDTKGYVNDYLIGRIRDWMKPAKNRKIAVFAHGGLNDEEVAVSRATVMGPAFKENGIYPIFIVWKTGWRESLVDMGEDVLKKILPGGWDGGPSGGLGDWIREKAGEGWDYTVENSLGFLGKSLWSQMKQNAQAANSDAHCGSILAAALNQLAATVAGAEIHLLGHSAGSIWLGRFLSKLQASPGGGQGIASCQLFAAACTVGFANSHFIPAIQGGVLRAKKFQCYNLTDEAEREDTVGGFYRKSLLYFVSRACEDEHKTPILGLQAAWDKALDKKKDAFNTDKQFQKDLADWRKFAAQLKAPVLIPHDRSMYDGNTWKMPTHGGFDNDIGIVSAALGYILGTPLPKPVKWLVGY